jgi:hypothetical protein
MKIKLKGRIISTKKGTKSRIRRIIKVCEKIKIYQTDIKAQMTNFVITMLTNKLKCKSNSIKTK